MQSKRLALRKGWLITAQILAIVFLGTLADRALRSVDAEGGARPMSREGAPNAFDRLLPVDVSTRLCAHASSLV